MALVLKFQPQSDVQVCQGALCGNEDSADGNQVSLVLACLDS